MQPGCSGDWADELKSLAVTGKGQGLLLAPIAQTAKPATINRTDSTRFTAIIRFIKKGEKIQIPRRIVETAMGLASFFSVENSSFLPAQPSQLQSSCGRQLVNLPEKRTWQSPKLAVDTKFA
jgi:hypothetical protein